MPTGDAGLARELVRAFGQFGPAFFRWMQACTAGSGMSFPRIRLIGELGKHGPKIMNELSELLGVTPRNITALVDALEGEGLVVRRQHPTDRRATIIELTVAGAETSRRLTADHEQKMIELFAVLSPVDQRELLRLIGVIHHELSPDADEGS